jgi:uncharacterized protein (DUF2344 family)
MKILFKKQQEKILKKIAENEVIGEDNIAVNKKEDIEQLDKFIENGADIAYLVGGLKGMESARGLMTQIRNEKMNQRVAPVQQE